MKYIYTIILFTLSYVIFGQIGMGTPTPRGALDINEPTTNRFGLVLPTNSDIANMVNPQGGTIAEGTIMYDSKLKCARIFDGTAWSTCLVDALPASPLTVDCSGLGFNGIFRSGTPLSGVTFRVSVKNNSSISVGPLTFQASDLVLSGISGITVNSVSPTSPTIAPGQSQILSFNLTGSPSKDGTLTGTFSKLNSNCSASVNVNKMVRIGNIGTYSIGGTDYTTFNSQLRNTVNYGTSGKYTGNFQGFSFLSVQLTNVPVQELLDKYDIISVQVNKLALEDVTKIKEYVDKGGVALLSFNTANAPAAADLFHIFGGTGTLSTGTSKATTTTEGINNGIFGNATNISIDGDTGTTRFNNNSLPSGSVILAEDALMAKIFVMGSDGRVICFWDEDFFRKTAYIDGSIINTPQEIALHNIMAYALGKAGL